MGQLIKPDVWWASTRRAPPEPPDMDLTERVAKIEAVFPTLATKEDLVREIGGLRNELHQEIGGLRNELHQAFGGLDCKLHQEVGGLRAEMHQEFSAQTWRIITWVTGLFVTVGGAMVAATYFIAGT